MFNEEVSQSEVKVSPKSKWIRTGLMIFGGLALIGLGAAGVGYLAKTKPQLFGIKSEQNQVESDAEVKQLVEEVGKLIEIPTDETPTIATVTDEQKVKDQPFFKKAKSGDKVLVFSNSKKAILYRPSEKKIIEVGVVNINQQQEPTGLLTPTPALSVSKPPTDTPKLSPTLTPSVVTNVPSVTPAQ